MKRYLLIVVALLIIFSTNVTASEPAGREGVETVMDYLHVFPSELGLFDEIPYSVIKHINAQIQYGYNNWRVPTNEELSLLRANNYLRTNVSYLSNSKPLGIVLLVSDGEDYTTTIKENGETPWADLGLPSGVKWKKWNEDEKYYNYEQAFFELGGLRDGYGKFRQIGPPNEEEFKELIKYCSWTWTGSGVVVKGPNGNFIYLPAGGSIFNNVLEDYGKWGCYWSCNAGDSEMTGTALFFDYKSINTESNYMYTYMPVRLVKRE